MDHRIPRRPGSPRSTPGDFAASAGEIRAELRRRMPVLAVASLIVSVAVMAAFPQARSFAATATSRAFFFVLSPFTPGVAGLDDLPELTRVLARDGTEIGVLGDEQRERVDLDELPDHVPQAVLAAEDARFYDHRGVDPWAVLRAAFNTLTRKRVEGGSTVTQQLAKLNYTSGERTITRKVREVLYAAELERRYTKDELLEHYLNQIYFGQGAWGISVAAQSLFGVQPQELTLDQAAVLAGKIRAPEALDPRADPETVVERRDQVLDQLLTLGWIDVGEHEQAAAAPLHVVDAPPALRTGIAPQFIGYVQREAMGFEELAGDADTGPRLTRVGGFTIETTLDVRMQEAATSTVEEILGDPGDPAAAVVSVEPGDGAIRAYMGGLDPTLEFDLVDQGRRQAGSAFKPFAYMAGLDAGIDPRSRFEGPSPMTVDCGSEPWEVGNYSGASFSDISLIRATVHSVNTVYAQLVARIGAEKVADAARDAGIQPEELEPVCALALGALPRGVSPLAMAGAYATFAADGERATPYAITRIVDRRGDVVFERDPSPTVPVFERDRVGLVNGTLEEAVRSGTGAAAAIGRPMAGKTGTTDDHGNAWFVGYVPQLSTAVWIGHPEGDVPMVDVRGQAVTGGSFPAQIFARFMTQALEGIRVMPLLTASVDELDDLERVDETPTPESTPEVELPEPEPEPTVAPARRPTPRATPTPRPTPRRTASPSPSPTPCPSPTPTPDDGDSNGDPCPTPTPTPQGGDN